MRYASGCAVFLCGLAVPGVFPLPAQAQPLNFVPVTPCRIADTRNADGAFGGPTIAGGTSREFVIPNSSCGIPPSSAAYSLNVAVVPKVHLGYLTVWPTGQSQPLVATLNSLDGRIKSNAAIVPAGVNGAISVFATDTTDVILDINGYFVPASNAAALAFYPLTPCRIADTRNAVGPLGGPGLVAHSTRTFPILASTCGVPANAQAYSLNFASVPKGPLGYLTAWPTGQTQPLVASLNALTGTVTANAVIVPAGTNGGVDVFSTDATDLVIDINGYFAPQGQGGLSLYGVTPCRVLDTRLPPGAPPFTGTREVNVSAASCGLPATAQAYVFNATVVPPGALGYITMWPQGEPQPVVATLNAVDGAVTSNMAIVPTANGSIDVFASAPTHLVLDIFGYFAQNTSSIPAPTNLQAVATSPTTANLTWVNNDPAATAVRVEIQTLGSGAFQDIGLAFSLTAARITNLQPNTAYVFRVRAQQGSQYSPYSNTAAITTPATAPPLTITTPLPPPAATVGVAYALSLSATGGVPPYSWSIYAGTLPPGLALNTSTGLISGAPTASGAFTFTVQVRDSNGLTSIATFSLTVQTSITPMQTVFLVHGIRQGSRDMSTLAQSLSDPYYGIDLSRFQVDYGFDWSRCANVSSCPADCSISEGGQELASYIISHSTGDVIIIGYSMGGLLARDMMLNNYYGVFNTHRVSALITLGTPNVGYPYVNGLDNIFICTALGQEMFSDYRQQQATNTVLESPYLFSFNNVWTTSSVFAGQPQQWFAASGTFCSNPIRYGDANIGCPDSHPYNDGVVCDLSARFSLSGDNRPTQSWSSSNYAHTTVRIPIFTYNSLFQGTCDWTTKFSLSAPPTTGDLVNALRMFINGL